MRTLKKGLALTVVLTMVLSLFAGITVFAAATATVGNVTVTGTVGTALAAGVEVPITIADGGLKAITATGSDLKSWITNLPAGLTAKAKADVATDDTSVTIVIEGTPTAASTDAIAIVIPQAAFNSAETANITVAANANAKFAITAASTGGDTLGNTVTVRNSGIDKDDKVSISGATTALPKGAKANLYTTNGGSTLVTGAPTSAKSVSSAGTLEFTGLTLPFPAANVWLKVDIAASGSGDTAVAASTKWYEITVTAEIATAAFEASRITSDVTVSSTLKAATITFPAKFAPAVDGTAYPKGTTITAYLATDTALEKPIGSVKLSDPAASTAKVSVLKINRKPSDTKAGIKFDAADTAIKLFVQEPKPATATDTPKGKSTAIEYTFPKVPRAGGDQGNAITATIPTAAPTQPHIAYFQDAMTVVAYGIEPETSVRIWTAAPTLAATANEKGLYSAAAAKPVAIMKVKKSISYKVGEEKKSYLPVAGAIVSTKLYPATTVYATMQGKDQYESALITVAAQSYDKAPDSGTENPPSTDAEQTAVNTAAAALTAADVITYTSSDSATGVTGNLTLGSSFAHGGKTYTITWTSNTTDVIANNGTVTRPASTGEDTDVVLTATLAHPDSSAKTAIKTFSVKVLKSTT